MSKTLAWIFGILSAVLLAVMVAMLVIRNKKPSFEILSVTGGIAKVKVGKKEYSYTLNGSGDVLSVGAGKYNVIFSSIISSGSPVGVVGQIYDGSTGVKVDAPKSMNQ